MIIVAFSMIVLLGIGAHSWSISASPGSCAARSRTPRIPAAIAAARYIEEGDSAATRTKMHAAACFYAQQNDFFTGDNATCDAARAAGDLQVLWPTERSARR